MLILFIALGVLLWITTDFILRSKPIQSSGMEEFCRVECLHYVPSPIKSISLIDAPLASELELRALQTNRGGYKHV